MVKNSRDSESEGLAPLFSLEEFRIAREKSAKSRRRKAVNPVKSKRIAKFTPTPPPASAPNDLEAMIAAFLADPLHSESPTGQDVPDTPHIAGMSRISAPKVDAVASPIQTLEPADLVVTGRALRHYIRLLDSVFSDQRENLDRLGANLKVPALSGSHACRMFRELNRELLKLPSKADNDVGWVLQLIAEKAVACSSGVMGKVLASSFNGLLGMVDGPKITPVVLLRWLRELENLTTEALLPEVAKWHPPLMEELLADVVVEMEIQPEMLSLEDLLMRTWASMQVSFCDGTEQNGGEADPRSAVMLLCAAAAAHLYAEETGQDMDILQPTIEMIAEVSGWNDIERYRHTNATQKRFYEVAWQGELTDSQLHKLVTELRKQRYYGAVAGCRDLFGIGLRAASIWSMRPQAVIKVLPTNGVCVVRSNRHAPELLAQSQIVANLVMLNQWGQVSPKAPLVVAFTRSVGLVAELAGADVEVVYAPNPAEIDLARILSFYDDKLVQLVPGDSAFAARLSEELTDLELDDTRVILSPTTNELQMLQVAIECSEVVAPSLSVAELFELQKSRTYQALESQRTWEIDPESEETLLVRGVSSSDEYVRVLLPQQIDAQFVGRLQAAILQKASAARVDFISGSGHNKIVIGALNK